MIEIINLMLDFVLIVVAIWMISSVKYIGGIFGRAFNLITWGAVILGVAHLLETVTFEFFESIGNSTAELMHRLVILIGFFVITLGFKKLAGAYSNKKK